MAFTRKSADLTPMVDGVFAIAQLAKEDKAANGEENVVDATIGSLYGEEGQLVALDTVFDHYDAIDHRVKARYASGIIGNPSYRKAVYDWVIGPSNVDLCSSVIATPGGSGAISTAITTFLDAGETVILPDIAWGSYTEDEGRKALGLSLEVNHRLIDGVHIGRFAEALNNVLNEL